MKNKSNFKIIIFYIVLIGIILFTAVPLMEGMKDDDPVYSDIITMFKEEKVKEFVLDESNILEIITQDDKKLTYAVRDIALFINDLGDLIEQQKEAGIIVKYDYPAPMQIPLWVSFLPTIILLVVLIVLFWMFFLRQTAGGGRGKINSFGKAKAKFGYNEKERVLFTDVAGADEEKEELVEIVEFLKDPQKFASLGAKIPHGVLMVGPPGTGKTLLAKAVAGEAGVPFYSISGSDFVEMYVGVGASRVRDLFETAKRHNSSIIFIDEIDAVGRHRGAGLGGGHDEREQTLNQLLVEMDGFAGNQGVIVMAATNRPDILDPALLRPGRFDRQITVNYPDLKGREEILKVHSKNKPLDPAVDLAKIAQTTVGFTGADLANLLNESALHAARKNKSIISMDDIEEAMLKIIVGTRKKSMKLKEAEKLKTAYHEAGHAIIAHILPSLDPVKQISVIPSGKALGYTLNPPVEDKYSVYKNGLKEEIAMLLGGRVAEKIIYDDVSGGASNDIQRATSIARNMVTRLGMSDELGPIAFASEHSADEVFLGRDFSNSKNFSEETAAKIDAEIKKIIDGAYQLAEKTLRDNMDKLHFIAKYLSKYEVMDDAQFDAIMQGNTDEDAINLIAEERKRKAEEANEKRRRQLEEEKAQKEKDEADKAETDPETPEAPSPDNQSKK